jgi:hypothetical protein
MMCRLGFEQLKIFRQRLTVTTYPGCACRINILPLCTQIHCRLFSRLKNEMRDRRRAVEPSDDCVRCTAASCSTDPDIERAGGCGNLAVTCPTEHAPAGTGVK